LRTTVGYCEARVAPYSIYAVQNRECFTLFPDELFADLFTDVGRRSVPPIANDGLVSTSSLLVGVAASGASTGAILTAGIAGLAAGAMAMAADEYVSVSAVRRGARRLADRDRELAADPEGELEELTQIYQARGVPRELAEQVAVALHADDPLQARSGITSRRRRAQGRPPARRRPASPSAGWSPSSGYSPRAKEPG